MVDFPTTLIIGLGGVGSQIAAEIYKKFIDSNPSDIKKRNIFCLALDTDGGDVEKRKKMTNFAACNLNSDFGSLAQLVQSIALTRRGSLVRVQQFPQKQ